MSKPYKETIKDGDLRVHIVIEPGDKGWQLMIVNDHDEATQWEDVFSTKDEALREAKAAIAEQGVAFFAQSLNDYGI
jgi:hypothetical protein